MGGIGDAAENRCEPGERDVEHHNPTAENGDISPLPARLEARRHQPDHLRHEECDDSREHEEETAEQQQGRAREPASRFITCFPRRRSPSGRAPE